ncbi:MAG: dockerin type I repeat-containing protein [Clostridia bacterium]|nr:dockerin type I repeat-containing protein [Clostridia bacterium]
MKKTLSFLLSVCFVFSSFVFCVNAEETALEANSGKAYTKGHISVLATTFVNPDDYVGEGPFDFFGIQIVKFEVGGTADVLGGGLELYWVVVSPEVDTFEAVEILNNTDGIEMASLSSSWFIAFDWRDYLVETESPFIEMTEDERKGTYFFVPDEVTVCLDYELDLSEFEGEGEHYLFGVAVGEINRSEDEDGYVYNIKYGEQDMENCFAVRVFDSNEHVLWTKYESIYGSGDINEDGTVDSSDYLLAKRICFGTYAPTNFEYGCVDMNFDGIVDSADYLLLKRYCFDTYVPDNGVIGSDYVM